MKLFLGLIGLTLMLVSSIVIGNQLTPCGQGVVIRPNNAVMIDKWMVWVNGMPVTNPTNPPMLQQTDAPSRIVIGEGVGDKIPVCTETETAIKCTTLGEIRKLAK